MSKFIGVKMVEAVPMTAIEADKKGYKVGKEVNNGVEHFPNPEGYEVTYPDGYKSWCPKDVFEKNNVLIQGLCGKIAPEPNKENESFVQRVIDEYNKLNVKYIKLSAFIDSDKMNELDKEDQDDLVYQANAMIAYISILNKRINKLLKKYPSKDIKTAFTLDTPYLQVKIIPGTKCDFATASKYNIAGAYKNCNFNDNEPGTIILNESGTFWIPDFQSWATLKELEKPDNKEHIVGFTIKDFELKENSGIINVEFNRIDISNFDKEECIKENIKNVIDDNINNVLK